jgi:hypothetical protein
MSLVLSLTAMLLIMIVSMSVVVHNLINEDSETIERLQERFES